MRRLLIILAFMAGSAFAGGTAYYTTSRVTITGPSDLGAVQAGAEYQTNYSIRASSSPLVGVSIGGDPEFTVDDTPCLGARSCTPTISLLADVGGDYVATITARSANAPPRVRGSSATLALRAHVVGASYTLSGSDNGDSTATYTLTSTGEMDLVSPSFEATTLWGVGTATVTGSTCGDAVPPGTSCTITVAFSLGGEPDGYGVDVLLLQAYANTKQQPPAQAVLVLPPVDD
jgi:hypothetical protein